MPLARPTSSDIASGATYAAICYWQNPKSPMKDHLMTGGGQILADVVGKYIHSDLAKTELVKEPLWEYDIYSTGVNLAVNMSGLVKKDTTLNIVAKTVISNVVGRYLKPYLPVF